MKSTDDTAPMTTTLPADPGFQSHRKRTDDSPPSEAALRNERQRTNAPFQSNAWDHIPNLSEEDRNYLRWFHLHCLDRHKSNTEIGEILGYDRTNAYRILSGTYKAGTKWSEIVAKIRDYRTRSIESTTVPGIDKEPLFVPTATAELFHGAIDYASRGGFVILAGDSGAGKTKTLIDWDLRHPGRMVRFNAPLTGGHVSLIRDLGNRIGMGALNKVPTATIMRGIISRISADQIIVTDQGSRLLPGASQIRSTSLEVLMELNERTGCGIIIPLTWRSIETMKDMAYQIEQITGRAEIFRAPQITLEDITRIAMQYGQFSHRTHAALHQLSLKPGALRTVAKILSLADRIARYNKAPQVTDNHVAEAIAKRFENMGGADPFDTDIKRKK